MTFRITGCLEEETKVLKLSTRSTKKQRWRSRGNRSKSNNSFCPRENQEAGWEGAWVAAAQEAAELTSPRMRDGTQCPSPRIDPSTPHALARSQR